MNTQVANELAECEDGRPRTIFIRGIMPRSGTNFLADALTNHPAIEKSPRTIWEFVPFRFHSKLDDYLESVGASKHANDFSAEEMLEEFGEAWVRYLRRNVNADQTILLKEPSVENLDRMFAMFPESLALIIVRDGRDVVESSLNAEFTFPKLQWHNPRHWRRLLPDEDFRILCRRYATAAESIVELLDRPTGNEQVMLVRYEDLVQQPESTITDVLKWAGLPVSDFKFEAFRQMPVRGSSYLRNEDGSMNFAKGVSKPKDFASVQRWESWSAKRHDFYQSIAGHYAAKLGYEPLQMAAKPSL